MTKKRQYGLLRGRLPTLLPAHPHLLVPAEIDCAYAAVLLGSPPHVREIAKACQAAARSLAFEYGPFDLYTLARLQEDDAAQAVAIYQLVADLQAREFKL